MEVIDPSWKKWQLMGTYLQKVFVVLAICLSSAQIVSLVSSAKRFEWASISAPFPVYDRSKIGEGGIGFLSQQLSLQGSLLAQELLVVGKNTKPQEGGSIALMLRSTGEKRDVLCNEKLYLAKDKAGYKFSKSPSDVTIVLQNTEGDEVIFFIEPTSEKLVLKPSWLFRQSIEEESYVQLLRKAKLWGSDQLLCSFGGGEYASLGMQHKVEIAKRVLFLSEEETLWWDGDSWVQGYKQGAPIAKLRLASAQGVQMEVWGESGFEHVAIEIGLHQPLAPTLRPSEMMASVKARSTGEISCQLGKRRVLVREGDWWIKAGQRWRPVRTTRDLEAVLHHEIQGELVMFDKIEAASGKVTVKGRYFDRMRTEMEPLLLSLSTEKKQAAAPPKHGSSPTKMAAKSKLSPPQLGQRNDEE